MRELKTYIYNGTSYTMEELSARFELCPKQIRQRMRNGIPLEEKIGSGRKSKYPTFVWDGIEISMTDAMHKCGCGKSTLFKYLDEGKTLDEIKAIMDAKRLSTDGNFGGYESGWMSAEQVAKKFNVNYDSLKWIIRSRGIEHRNFNAMHGQRMAIKIGDIERTVKLTLDMLESLRLKAGPAADEEDEEDEVSEESCEKKDDNIIMTAEREKLLARLRAKHPLVKDDRCFITTWFPHLETFHIEDW